MNLGTLHPKQSLLYQTRATEILYGGAAGGGKSHGIRATEIMYAAAIPGIQIYLFRRQSVDLEKNHLEGPMGFRAMLAEWTDAGWCKIVQGEIRFWNGSKIYLCHCKDAKDVYNYQGAEMHLCDVDEATHFSESMLSYIRTRVRCAGLNIPAEYQGCFPRIRYFTNPGNIGHDFIKRTFVDMAARLSTKEDPYPIWKAPKEEGGMFRQFIPALLEDNPSMTEHDPEYEFRLLGVGNAAVAKALRYGDWSVIAGSYFPEFCRHHIVEDFTVPDYWTRFTSFDWGYAKPFCVLWFAVSDGEIEHIPKGALVVYREWYGADGPDEGLRMTVEQVAAGVLEREVLYRYRDGRKKSENITYRVADPAIFTADGGPSMAERFAEQGVVFRPADNKRIAGWNEVRERFRLRNGQPMLYLFESIVHGQRIIPLQQHDEKRPEDLNTDLEDHWVDTLRYGVMSRPMVKLAPPEKKPVQGLEVMTLDELWKMHEEDLQKAL